MLKITKDWVYSTDSLLLVRKNKHLKNVIISSKMCVLFACLHFTHVFIMFMTYLDFVDSNNIVIQTTGEDSRGKCVWSFLKYWLTPYTHHILGVNYNIIDRLSISFGNGLANTISKKTNKWFQRSWLQFITYATSWIDKILNTKCTYTPVNMFITMLYTSKMLSIIFFHRIKWVIVKKKNNILLYSYRWHCHSWSWI